MNQYIDQQLHPFVNYYQDNWLEILLMIDYACHDLHVRMQVVDLYIVE